MTKGLKATTEAPLTTDEYDALRQVAAGSGGDRPSACVARNAKRLTGLKFTSYAKNGALQLTDKGTQTLFIKSCIEGLRAVALDPLATLNSDVQSFLGKKGHLAPASDAKGFELTQRGRESLDDIDKTAR
jgi:hypothetical protein